MKGSRNDNDSAAVEINNLTKRFGNFTAVDNLSLIVKYGEIFGLLGPNGSGKTVTINMISGLSRPSSGEVKVLGYNIAHNTRAVHAVLGTVPQETALYEELSAWTNMSVHADLYGVPRSDRDTRITDMLKLVELYDRRHSRVNTFSGGMKRRLALARALLHDPQLLYLDEPTLGVDVQSRRAIWDYIIELKKEGRTVLLTTNYLEEANFLCDKIAIIDHGKLVALDTPVDLKRKYGHTILEVETTIPPSQHLLEKLQAMKGISNVIVHDDRVIKVVMTAADDNASTTTKTTTGELIELITHGAGLNTIAQRQPNLDEIFLSLTGSGLRD